MSTVNPRVNQWVIYGDSMELGKVEQILRKYGKSWCPVEKVFVRQRDGRGFWYPIERVRVIPAKEAREMYAKETRRRLEKATEN